MPLPEPGSRWLPDQWAPAYDRYRVDEAIWLNDTATLRGILSGGPTNTEAGRATAQITKRRGVLLDFARRWNWGRQPQFGEKRTDLPVPIGANVADLSASQLMAEPPMFRLLDAEGKFRAAQRQDARQVRLDTIANSDDARMTLIEAAQTNAAIGGVVLKAQWDTTDPDREAVWFDSVGADCALPEFNAAGRLIAVTLWQEYPAPGSKVYRHFERHYVGGIEHALYLGTAQSVGRLVPLDLVETTSTIATMQGVQLDGPVATIPTGLNRLTAGFWRNRPTRSWRRSGSLAFLGRSDFELIEPEIDAYSEAWGSLMRDIRLGKARAFVPQGALERINGTAGSGAVFDPDREFYQEVGGLNPDAGSNDAVKVEQPELRWEAHLRTLAALKLEILDGAGWSLSSYGNPSGGENAGGSATATEVVDRTTKSERTRDEKALLFKQTANGFVRMLMELDALVYPGGGAGDVSEELSIDFPDVSQVDPAKQAQTFLNLNTAHAISIEQQVRERRPNWDDDAVDEEVARIWADVERLNGGATDPALLGRREQITLQDDPAEPPAPPAEPEPAPVPA